MIIEKVVAGPLRTNAYLVGCSKSRCGIIIDPGFDSAKRLSTLTQKHELKISGIYLTHAHDDHIGNLLQIHDLYQCPVFGYQESLLSIENKKKLFSFSQLLPQILKKIRLIPLQDREIHKIGTLTFSVLHTPGHSPDGVCFYFEKEAILFSGDLIFKGCHGRTDLPGSNARDIKNSLDQIKKLPKNVIVYPGHFDRTTIGEETWL